MRNFPKLLAGSFVVHLYDCQESFLWNLDGAHLLHALFTCFLFFQQLLLTADVAAVALGQHVLAQRLDVFARDHVGADGCLDGHVEHLARDQLAHLGGHLAAAIGAVGAVHDDGQCIDFFAVDQHVDLDHVGGAVFLELVVHRRVTARGRFQLVEEVQHDLAHRHFIDQLDLAAVVAHVQLHAALADAQRDHRATYSCGMYRLTVTMGSRISSMRDGSGIRDGLSTFSTVPSRMTTSYTTVGAVVIRSMSNSRSRRSCTISMCSRPRKPQRKPKPSACDTSGSYISAASFSFNFSSESRSASYWLASTGNRPANTCGWTSLKPGSGAAAGRLASVMVSPTLATFNSLMPAITKPTCPADSACSDTERGANTPTSSTSCTESVAIKRILSFGFSVPLTTRTSMTTPT